MDPSQTAKPDAHLTLTNLKEGVEDDIPVKILSFASHATHRQFPEPSIGEWPGFAWAHWQVDRFLGLVPDHVLEEFSEDLSEDEALAVSRGINDYGFDGQIAFIPQSHAEHFWRFLVDFSVASINGEETFEFDGAQIKVNNEDLLVGDSPAFLIGRPSAKGLWILFAESDESFGTAWISEAIKAYPHGEALREVDVELADKDLTQFDATRAWTWTDTHLGDHFHFDRMDREGANPAGAFLLGGYEDGAFTSEVLRYDFEDAKPWTGRRVCIVENLSQSKEEIIRVLSEIGAEATEQGTDATHLLIADKRGPSITTKPAITEQQLVSHFLEAARQHSVRVASLPRPKAPTTGHGRFPIN